MKKISSKIVIIDSGSSFSKDNEHPDSGVFLERVAQDRYSISCNVQDEIGHGTGIHGIIKQHDPSAEIFLVKICDRKNSSPQVEDLLYALKYVSLNVECKVINMALSLVMTENVRCLEELESLCEQLSDKGIVLVSAFDNMGSISYPAAFRSVIGVTAGSSCHKSEDVEYVENDIVNLCGHGAEQKVASNTGGYTTSKGNSLACAHITGIISKFIENSMRKEEVLQTLKGLAQKCHTGFTRPNCNEVSPIVNYNKVVVFPFNKEIHNLIRYQAMLRFEIVGVYDTKYSGYVHSTTNDLLHIEGIQNHKIQNVENMDYESFDTLILGHTDQIEEILVVRRQIHTLINNCITKRKYIFSFDERCDLACASPYFFSPQIKREMVALSPFGKLYRNPKPVLGVFGTSSRQGKFSIQLILRKLLSEKGYIIGQIGTEPTAMLFGMDAGFHFGYNTSTDVVRYDTVSYLNQKINEIAKKDVDIIIVGCQSRSLPVDCGNMNGFTFPQLEFLFATQPDIFVLCVNPWDDLEYISRTILFLESAVCGQVLALVMYPYDIVLNAEGTAYEKYPLTDSQYAKVKCAFEKQFSLPVFHLGYERDHQALVECVINSLA